MSLSAVARSYVGTPFDHQGRVPGPNGGIDCVGLIICAGWELGWNLPNVTNYGRESDPQLLLKLIDEHFDRIPFGQQQPDDVFSFWEVAPHLIQHLGVYTGPTLIHAFDSRSKRGKVREERLLPTRMAKLYGVHRYRGAA